MKRIILLAVAIYAISGSWPSYAQDGIRTYPGERIPMGQGFIRSWVTMDSTGKPIALGFAFNKAVLSGLPDAHTEHMLALPFEVAPFNHIVADWNPQGHIPPGVYDVPHFDFHFYMISPQARNEIVVNDENMPKFTKAPGAEFMPKDYIMAPGGENDRMGMHWVDPNSPEFHGQSFETTFIYGTYDGHMAFVEPMVAKAFLEAEKRSSAPIKQPQAYEREGYYPTRYAVRYDADRDRYYVALQDLVYRE